MKRKIAIILLIISVILGIIFSLSLNAGTGKLYTSLTALNTDGIGYGVGNPEETEGANIWHMSTYDSDKGGISDVQKNIYCLQAEYGASWEDFEQESPILEYNMVFDMQTEREKLSSLIVDNGNNADDIVQGLIDEKGTKYTSILWLLDNMYIKGETNLDSYLAQAGIIKDEDENLYYNKETDEWFGSKDSSPLTEDDIIAIQRMAIWYFANSLEDGSYDKLTNSNWLYINKQANSREYIDLHSVSDSREAMATHLYKYLVTKAKNASSLYTSSNNYTISDAPVEVNINKITQANGKYIAEIKGSDYLIGPIVINKNNDMLYDILMTVTAEDGSEISTTEYSLVDANGKSLGNVTLKDLSNSTEGFYIKLATNLTNKVNIQIDVNYYNTTKNLWLQGSETTEQITLNAEQPVAEIVRETKKTIVQFSAEPELIDVPVKKVWKDNENNDGIRPEYVTVQLIADGQKVEGKTLTLNADNNWENSFTGLPKTINGVDVVYTVKESPVPTNYTEQTTGNADTTFTITNTHEIEYVDVLVTKVWNDNNDQDGIRPEAVTIALKNGTKTEDVIELNEENNWKYTFENLPKHSNGSEINYDVQESGVPVGYTSVKTGNPETGFVITNTHEIEYVDVSVTKVWDDNNDQDGIRPEAVTIALKNGSKTEDVIELNEKNNWTHTFENLLKYSDGYEISYDVQESGVPVGYTSVKTGDAKKGFIITNTHKIEYVDVSVKKVWEDENDQDGIRPDEITIALKNGSQTVDTVKLNETNNWTHTFKNLLKYSDGYEINYDVQESGVPEGYTSAKTGNAKTGFIITNTHEIEYVDVSITKEWNDNNNQDGIRPEEVTVVLKNGEKTEATVKLNEANKWKHTFIELPKYSDGNLISYDVQESQVSDGYTASKKGSMETGFVITNTHEIERVTVSVRKEWDDSNNQDGIRPEEVTIALKNGSQTVETVKLNNGNNWTNTFTNAPKYSGGNPINYTVQEVSVPTEYTSKIEGDMATGFVITNTHEIELIDIVVRKKWKDNDNQDGIRPENISISLKNGNQTISTIELNDNNNWQESFTNLPKYSNGSKINYDIEETEIPEGYTSEKTGNANDGFVVTNTHEVQVIDVSVRKEWNDKNNQDGIRPEEVTIVLKNGENIVSEIGLNEENNWKHTFTQLPKKENGNDVDYVVEEKQTPDGYTVNISGSVANGFVITNTHEIETINVTVEKRWEDNNNQDGIRPEEVTVVLKNGENSVSEIELNEENNWKYTFMNVPKNSKGNAISYNVKEKGVSTGYTSEVSGNTENGFIVTNRHQVELINVKASKNWNDQNNRDGIRPTSVKIALKNGMQTVETIDLSEENNWSYIFENVPKYYNRSEVEYSVVEETTTEGYTAKVTGSVANGFVITNTHEIDLRNVSVSKSWDDGENQDGIRPESIVVNLKNGSSTVKSIELNAENEWSYTFTGLPKNLNGNVIEYTVDEANVPVGYTPTITGNIDTGYTITNTYTPGVTSVKVVKMWNDNDNQDGLRTDSVKVKLLKNNESYKSIELSDSNNWQYIFTGLPKKENGKDIVYSVAEITQIDGYTTTIEEKNVSTTSAKVNVSAEPEYIITNTHEIKKVFDLSLRKYITKINGENLSESRIPNIDESTLESGTTATYKHRKNPVQVKTGDKVTYSITVYNEGEKVGYASQIIDQLPTGLKYVSGNEVTSNKNTYKVTYDEETNRIIFNIAEGAKGLQPYEVGNLDSETIEVECEVTANASKEGSQILTNVAWISEAYDSEENKTIINVGDDRDSEPGTKPNVNKSNTENYKGNSLNKDQLNDNTYYYKGEQDDDDFEKILIPEEEKIFDLALRKYIIKINNNELSTLGLETRVPNISETTLINGTTASYRHRKNPVEVEENDIITYAITVYNEGEKAGYASQMIDQLPEGLIYNPSTTVKSNKNTYTVKYESSTNKVIFDIVNTSENQAQALQPYKQGKLDSETIEIKCKVIHRAKAGESNILTNVAWISEAYDCEDNKVLIARGDDRDSETTTKPNVNKDNMENYKGNSSNKNELNDSTYYYKGEQDDDDFEKVYVKTFDLALRKFVNSINGKKLTESREPDVDITSLTNGTSTTAIYNHSKTPIAVKIKDTVVYTIRIYNEGEIDGYASEVKDYLPSYLEYIENSSINKKYGWSISEDGRIVTTTYLSDKEIKAFNGNQVDYEDLQIECKISEKAIPDEKITNIAEISQYRYGDTVCTEDVDSKSHNVEANIPEKDKLPNYKENEEKNSYVPGNEDDDDFEKVYVKEFDLALRKFITEVQDKEITTRIPNVKYENGKITYEHTKDALTVHVGDVVIYTIRIYNEGEIDGYASEITDDIPEYLEYLPEESTNAEYMWKMYDENGKETDNVNSAIKLKTNYLSKENNEKNLLKGFDGNTLYYRDVKIAFKVKDPYSNKYIITNNAQISNDTDADGNIINDKDSQTNKWIEGEDDQDIENVKVEYFDLSILKFVSKVIIKENGTEKITQTGYNGYENPEPVVKVEVHKKKLEDVVVKFAYGITVTNEGDIPGYATEIKDYIPEGLKFEASDNPTWIDEGNNVISTKQLENTLLQPGESKTIEVMLTWINGKDNLALKTNTVEIFEDKNEYNLADRDSVPGNKKDSEDDIDVAKVILAVSTGSVQTYFVLTLGLLGVIAIGVVLIKKFVI